MLLFETEVVHANCVQMHQLQPLLAGFCSSSVPPALVPPPVQPLWELPAPPFFSPLQALFAAQPLKESVDPVIKPAMARPARIFFSSSVSIRASCLFKNKYQNPPGVGFAKSEILN
jgi:hypothetical protein